MSLLEPTNHVSGGAHNSAPLFVLTGSLQAWVSNTSPKDELAASALEKLQTLEAAGAILGVLTSEEKLFLEEFIEEELNHALGHEDWERMNHLSEVQVLFLLERGICPTCGGQKMIDSGGYTPWGSPIDICCPTCNDN